MTKDQALNFLEDFYVEMQEAEVLSYQSCKRRDEQQVMLFNKYAALIMEEIGK